MLGPDITGLWLRKNRNLAWKISTTGKSNSSLLFVKALWKSLDIPLIQQR